MLEVKPFDVAVLQTSESSQQDVVVADVGLDLRCLPSWRARQSVGDLDGGR
jgi:hypothetical protein